MTTLTLFEDQSVHSAKSETDLAKALECYQTSPWVGPAILRVELLTGLVIDPCCGTGQLSLDARAAGYDVLSYDIHDWGFEQQNATMSWLDDAAIEQQLYLDCFARNLQGRDFSVFMNPPFSLATEFVDQALFLGARKVVCFQRGAWRESDERRAWWAKNPPSRKWLCGDRAPCRRFDLSWDDVKSGFSHAMAFYVWERGHPGPGPELLLYKDTGLQSPILEGAR